jgi:hypothetical protein
MSPRADSEEYEAAGSKQDSDGEEKAEVRASRQQAKANAAKALADRVSQWCLHQARSGPHNIQCALPHAIT